MIRIGEKEVITRWGDYKGFSPMGITGDGVYSSMVCTISITHIHTQRTISMHGQSLP